MQQIMMMCTKEALTVNNEIRQKKIAEENRYQTAWTV